VLQAQQHGERLTDARIADYLQQLANVDADREGMEERIRQFWSMLGKERAH